MARPIVAFGDSYTEGWGARASEAYPARLGARLGRPVLNAGSSGETAEEGLLRLQRDVLSQRPELVLVGFGTNEASRGYPPERALAGLGLIVSSCRAAGAKVVLFTVRYGPYQEAFEAAARDMARRHGAGFLGDALGGVLDDPRLRSDDAHPNAEGYAVLAERILPEARRQLGLPTVA